MSKFVISENFNCFLSFIEHNDEFKKLQYYMRCLKKAPHGGVFINSHQSVFLRYYPIQIYTFTRKGQKAPYPNYLFKSFLDSCVSAYSISVEELLVFTFCIDDEDKKDIIFGESLAGDKLYCAMTGGVLSPKNPSDYSFDEMILKAVYGKMSFLDLFNYDYSRLLEVFLLFLLRINLARFATIDDIKRLENLESNSDKYGLIDISHATFERQGFSIENKYYLYSIFFDTSIGTVNANVPLTLEIIKRIPNARIYMRRDNTLAVPAHEKVTTATIDMQKWRGITLDLNNIEKKIKRNKETTVHWDPESRNKVLVVIKPFETETHEVYYQISVEELWSPGCIYDFEDTVITNYIHGCYYPSRNTFDHIDFSVNQYAKELYLKKYEDSISETSISIEQYAETHYKIWCVKSDNLSLQAWADLVIATLDQPFRGIFAEIIGAEIKEIK